jgi:SAM-dependent methyltransferase
LREIKDKVSRYYDAAARYHEQYEKDRLYDLSAAYPANYFRLQLLLDSFKSKGISNVIEVGVGEGTPLSRLGSEGIDVWGFDISEQMVEEIIF